MKAFSYTVKNPDGRMLKGSIEAESQEKLIEHFHQQNYIIFSIEAAKKKSKLFSDRGVKTDELVIFSRQFTTLIESGIPAVEALGILEEQVSNATFRKAIGDILKDIKE